ncbi:restriction endonuclease subunit S [Tepidanaerobacter acetatoxydans]|uniref:restriction endonuclease subunit S n=1 Tax=Tepidanaerobacter acetatoxydans TaxID=499229 RepID=UPI001BD5E153|nr:restriction endonuclease subunit S [Tepidanaerobacter acetatoxydans]
MSNFKRYDKYKDSGIEWIGEIPEGWEVTKLKYICSITMGQSPKSEEYSREEGGLPFLQGNAEFTELYPHPKIYCDTANKRSKVNDILLSVRAPVGKMNISNRVYGIGRGLCAITAQKVHLKYLWYSMNVSLEELSINSQGSTFEAVTVADVNNLSAIVPPADEQISIANFLDQKTAEIDDLIVDKEKLIELLQEKRQAVITEAVTKGLNPNVKMNDSGIEWIGEIPEGWEVKKLKYVTKFAYGDSLPVDEREAGDIDVFGSNGKIGTHAVSNTSSPVVIVGRKGSYGKVTYVEKECFAIDTTYYIDNRCTTSNIKWLYYLLTILELDKNSQDTGVPGLSREYAYNKYVFLPPIDKQISIANFLDRKTAEIDSLVSEIQEQIQKLREYRQSLIFEAVTGKIDVRDYAAIS